MVWYVNWTTMSTAKPSIHHTNLVLYHSALHFSYLTSCFLVTIGMTCIHPYWTAILANNPTSSSAWAVQLWCISWNHICGRELENTMLCSSKYPDLGVVDCELAFSTGSFSFDWAFFPASVTIQRTSMEVFEALSSSNMEIPSSKLVIVALMGAARISMLLSRENIVWSSDAVTLRILWWGHIVFAKSLWLCRIPRMVCLLWEISGGSSTSFPTFEVVSGTGLFSKEYKKSYWTTYCKNWSFCCRKRLVELVVWTVKWDSGVRAWSLC